MKKGLTIEVLKDLPSPDEMDEEEKSESMGNSDGPAALKEMYELMKSGDFDGAHELFMDAVAGCK